VVILLSFSGHFDLISNVTKRSQLSLAFARSKIFSTVACRTIELARTFADWFPTWSFLKAEDLSGWIFRVSYVSAKAIFRF